MGAAPKGPCPKFLTEEDEEAVNHAGRRPARFAADEDDEVKNFGQGPFGAAPMYPQSLRLHVRGHSYWGLLSSRQ